MSSLVNVTGVPANLIASKPNPFFGEKIYNEDAVYLVPAAAEALKRASDLAQSILLNVVVLDAYRPTGVQQILYDASPKDGKYVKHPEEGNHCKGIAVDVTLQDLFKTNLINQTMAGSWVEASHAFSTAQLPIDTIRKRFELQLIMIANGWLTYKYEWWHFDLSNDDQLLTLHDTLIILHRIRLSTDEMVIALSNKLNEFEEEDAGKIKAAFIKLIDSSIEELLQCDKAQLVAHPRLETVYPALDERPNGIPGKELDGLLRQLFERSRQK